MKKTITQYCVNERSGEIIPYTVNADFTTTFPKGTFLSYRDNFAAGFTTLKEAREWANRVRRPVPTYRDLEIQKVGG